MARILERRPQPDAERYLHPRPADRRERRQRAGIQAFNPGYFIRVHLLLYLKIL